MIGSYCAGKSVSIVVLAVVLAGTALAQGTAPVATSVTPKSAIAHSKAVAVTIAGSNIASTAVLTITGPTGAKMTVTPSQVQSAQMAATIPAALLSTAGTAQIAIQNGPGALSNQLPFTIGGSIAIKTPALKDATVGAIYSEAVTASGGTTPYVWSLFAGALPEGLSLSSTGTISGIPTTPGPTAFTLLAKDYSGAVATAYGSITVKPTALAFTTGALPSGVVNFEYPRQVLGVSGGLEAYTYAVTSGTLPTGLRLTNGAISGIPTVAGTSAITLTVTDSAGTKATVNTSIVIRPAGTDLLLLSGGVSFALTTGSATLPTAQSVGVQSTAVGTTLNYTTATTSAPWLSVAGDGVTPGTLTLGLTSAALSLEAGTSTATVTLTCTTSACTGKTQTLAVSLVVASPPAQLRVATNPLWFRAFTTSQTYSQNVNLQNAGAGTLNITSMTCSVPWCSVGTFPTSLSAGAASLVTVTVDSSKLPAGTDITKRPAYRATVEIITSGGSALIPVVLSVSTSPYMSLSQSGDQFNMQAGGIPGNPPATLLVLATGGSLTWNATVAPGADWLTLTTKSGTSSDFAPSGIVYSVNNSAASLAAGTYFGNILVTSSGTSSTAMNFVVVLNVVAAAQPPTLAISPGALVFVTNAGASPTSQKISVYTNSTAPQSYQASATVTDSGAWLTVNAFGTTSASTPGQFTVNVDATKLAKGTYSGHVSYALGDAGVRIVDVTLIVLPAGVSLANASAGELLPHTPAATCTPTSLILAPTGIIGSFAAPAAWPTPIAMTLLNDCGKPVGNGQVVVTFSNGDSPLALTLASAASGLYSGTWVPRHPAGQLTINARGSAAGLPNAVAPVAGSVVPNAAPVLTPNGTVHPYNAVIGGALAPGTIVAIYGSNMATVDTLPTTTPLPTKVNGTTVLMGGIPAPLFYVSANQINAQIPWELDAARQYQIIVNANGALSTPQPLQLSAATPGIDAFLDGTVVALHLSTGALVSQDDPARPGEFLIMFLLGMGATDVPVPTGDVAPITSLVRVTAPVTLTLGGVPAPVLFSGLTPGLVGLYQINLQVPDVDVDGNLTLTVTQNGDVSNSTILPVLR